MGKKVLYLVADDRYFYTHRLPLASKAQDQGYEVTVASPSQGSHLKIQHAGLNFYPIKFNRGGINPWREIKTLWAIYKLFHLLKPDIVHLVALKPVLYGTFVGLFTRIPLIVSAISGLGVIFSQNHWLQKPVKIILKNLLCWKRVKVIVQNPDDAAALQSLSPDIQVNLILGAGVNTSIFYPEPEPSGPITIVHVSRLLWTKGINEFVSAAQILKQKGHNFRFLLVGEPDLENANAVPKDVIQKWHQEKVIEWLGYCEDISNLYQNCHIAVLASYYREGIPKSLLEAAACGKPIITCDMPGCRIIVQDGMNGYLIPPRNNQALADKILDLALNSDRRLQFGGMSRTFVLESFNEDRICQQTLNLYA